MPLVTIIGSANLTGQDLEQISTQTHASLMAHYGVQPDDKFHILVPGSSGVRIIHSTAYKGVTYSERMVVIQIIANNTRTAEQKQRLCQSLTERVCASIDFRSEDVIISLLDVPPENWSFGIAGEARN